jgi:hypothetical protein
MPDPTREELLRRISELEQQVQRKSSALEFRVSDKGAVSVYQLVRCPGHNVSCFNPTDNHETETVGAGNN